MERKNVNEDKKKPMTTRKGNEVISGIIWLIRERWCVVSEALGQQ
jgi:hypothetical protein